MFSHNCRKNFTEVWVRVLMTDGGSPLRFHPPVRFGWSINGPTRKFTVKISSRTVFITTSVGHQGDCYDFSIWFMSSASFLFTKNPNSPFKDQT